MGALGIVPEFIESGKPQQNGRRERMHKTLKAETMRPAANSLRAQQRKFDRVNVSSVCVGEYVGLGMLMEDELGRLRRHNV